MKTKRLLSATVLLAASALLLALTVAAPGSAYASTGGFHVAVSFACNSPSSCDEPGSLAIAGPFNADGTASAHTVGTSHLQGGPADGAQQVAITVADLGGRPGWFVGPDGNFWITNETDTTIGRTGGPPVSVFDPFPPYPSDTGIPATPGHYNSTEIFGFTPPPGVHFMIQVTKVPG